MIESAQSAKGVVGSSGTQCLAYLGPAANVKPKTVLVTAHLNYPGSGGIVQLRNESEKNYLLDCAGALFCLLLTFVVFAVFKQRNSSPLGYQFLLAAQRRTALQTVLLHVFTSLSEDKIN